MIHDPEILERHCPLAIVRLADLSCSLDVAAALLAGGIRHLEYSLTNRDALQAVTEARAHFGALMRLGIGTVLEVDDAKAAIDAGAEFLVTPVLAPDVLAYAAERAIPVACGAMTPTEMYQAYRLGAAYVKLFPAGRLGPGYVKDVLAPLPDLKIVCVGGVDATNAAAYLAAGAHAVGIGGSLVDPAAVARGDWSAITASASDCVQACMPASSR